MPGESAVQLGQDLPSSSRSENLPGGANPWWCHVPQEVFANEGGGLAVAMNKAAPAV